MEENSLTIAILREIRDEIRTTRTDLTDRIDRLTDRVDHLTDRVGSLESLTSTMAAVQVRQEQVLVRLAEASERHETALLELVRETRRIHDRIDNIYEGPVSSTLRDHETRIRRLEGRDD